MPIKPRSFPPSSSDPLPARPTPDPARACCGIRTTHKLGVKLGCPGSLPPSQRSLQASLSSPPEPPPIESCTLMKTESFLLVTTTSPVRVVVRPWEEGKLRRGGGGGGDLEGFSVRYRGTVSSSASSGDLESGTHHHSVHKCSFLQERPRGQLRDGEEGRTPPCLPPAHPAPLPPTALSCSVLTVSQEQCP